MAPQEDCKSLPRRYLTECILDKAHGLNDPCHIALNSLRPLKWLEQFKELSFVQIDLQITEVKKYQTSPLSIAGLS